MLLVRCIERRFEVFVPTKIIRHSTWPAAPQPNWPCLGEEIAFDKTRAICEKRYKKLSWTNPDKILAHIPFFGGMSTNEHNVTDALACCTDLQSTADAFRRCVTANQAFFEPTVIQAHIRTRPVHLFPKTRYATVKRTLLGSN